MLSPSIEQKTALVTGSNGDLGKSITKKLSDNGFQVIGLDFKKNTNDLVFEYIKFDLKKLNTKYDAAKLKSSINKILNKKGLDLLVNNAAIQKNDDFVSLSNKGFLEVMQVNSYAPIFMSKELLKFFNKGASIINIGSIHSKLTKPGFFSYSVSKGALATATRSMALSIGDKIRVNSIEPAALDTKMLRDGFKNNKSKLRQLKKYHPTNTIGSPDEVAELVLALTSGNLKFLNGSNIEINGGISSRLHDPV